MTDDLQPKPRGYGELLNDLKDRIQRAQVKAALAVNQELVLLYWSIGRDILDRQEGQTWGTKVLERLSRDLRMNFPDMRGFSVSNLKYMRNLAREWPEGSIGQQLVGQIPWGHNIRILERVKDSQARIWYTQACIENGWSRKVLEMQIQADLFGRQGSAMTNFERTLPELQSDLAQQAIKDPYNFDFLTLGKKAHEREIEQGLMDHLKQFLIELGAGFAFVGRQYRIQVGEQEFFIDLLFYHLKLRCYVVVELKAGDFKPEYAGKLNFYLTAVNEMLCHPDDNPTIGLLLCQGKKDKLVVEWALKGVERPIGVSEYQLTESLPKELRGQLPSIEDLEAELIAPDTKSDGE